MIVWIVVGRTLRPVERIRAEVADIGVAELDRRVPEPPGDDEIARLAVTMNAMLERLERSVSRQQRFVADASHELRTPLTRMRAELEVDDNDPANADPAATRRSQLDEIVGLQQMLEDLLILARSDAGTPTGRPGRSISTTSCWKNCDRGHQRPSPSTRPGCRPPRSSATPGSCAGWCATWSTTPHDTADRAS